MLARLKKEVAIEIQNIEREIKIHEEQENKDSLINQLHFYKYATEVCLSAKELAEDAHSTLDHDQQKKQYASMLLALKKVKEAVMFPTVQNANDLLKYDDNICHSKSVCNSIKNKRFWSAVKAIAGVILLAAGLAMALALSAYVAPIVTGLALSTVGLILFTDGLKEHVEYKEKLSNMKHMHLSIGHPNKQKTLNFLSKLSHFGKTAKTIGNMAENKYNEQEESKKNNILSSI